MHHESDFGRQQKFGEGSSNHVKRQQLEFFHIKMQALGQNLDEKANINSAINPK